MLGCLEYIAKVPFSEAGPVASEEEEEGYRESERELRCVEGALQTLIWMGAKTEMLDMRRLHKGEKT